MSGNLFIFEDNNCNTTLDQYNPNDSEFQREAGSLETQSARGREVLERNRFRRISRGRGGLRDRPASVGPPSRNSESATQRQIYGNTSALYALRIDTDETTINRDDDVNYHTKTYERQSAVKTGGRGGFQGRSGEKTTKTWEENSKRQETSSSANKQKPTFVRPNVLGTTYNDTEKVFDFMVRNMTGSGTPREISRQSGLIPKHVDLEMWFRQREDKFVLIEKDNSIHTVLVYDRNTTYCYDYTRQSCSRENCNRYHVCKNLLAGNCIYGPRKCKLSHYFFDPHNKKVSEKLGYMDKFTGEEIATILKVSQPHVCNAWILNQCCFDKNCIDLHICPQFILGKCNHEPGCSLCHEILSEHNKPIVIGFGMSETPEKFRKQVFLTKEQIRDRTEPAFHRTPSGTGCLKSCSSEGTRANKERIDRKLTETKAQTNLESDEAGDKNLCDLQLIGKCRGKRCDNLHGDGALPYLWQIHLFGRWATLGNHLSERIEKAFCENSASSDKIELTDSGIQVVGKLYFSPNSRTFFVDESWPDIENQARRLSTISYNVHQANDQESFKTQWIWYWENDEKWFLFEPDALQHTLEAKFAAKQSKYIYYREDYGVTYVINFKKMYQKNMETGNKRKIARRPVFVSAEDVKIKIFPMRLTDAPVIDVKLPEGWVPWDVAQPFEMVNILGNKSEADKVFKDFIKTIDEKRMTITAIYRIQNHELWRHFCSQERTMEVRRVGRDQVIDKRYLFHGTDSWEAVKGICINNFDARLSGKNAIRYGDGAYFARDAKYSHAYTNGPKRYIFMANVLVGQYTKGDASYRRPPAKPGSDHELYDSCVDNVHNPSVFVVFDKNQYYPEYLIAYEDISETSDINQSQQQQLTKPPLLPPRPRNVQHASYGQSPASVVDVQPQGSASNVQMLDTSHSSGACSVKRIALPPDLHAQGATRDGYRVANSYKLPSTTDIDSGQRLPRYNLNIQI